MKQVLSTLSIMGCPCLKVESLKQYKQSIVEMIRRGIGGYSVAINAEKIMMYQSDPALKETIDGSLLPSPDGIGAVIGAKWLYGIKILKVDLPKLMLDICHENGFKLYLWGATEEVNAKAAENVKAKYPNIVLTGRSNGYEPDHQKIIDEIRDSGAQIVFVCMGSPKQEILMQTLTVQIPGVIFMGCGGALDVLSGKVKRAPQMFQNLGLEWFYRLLQRPSLIKRQRVYPLYLFRLISLKFLPKEDS